MIVSRRVEASAGLALLIGFGGYVAAVDPHQPGSYPICPFHAATGLWCPGCGSLRALNDLLHGRLADALGYNALAVLVLPFVIAVGLRVVAFDRPPRRLPTWVPAAVLIVLALWTTARNLPYRPFSILAP